MSSCILFRYSLIDICSSFLCLSSHWSPFTSSLAFFSLNYYKRLRSRRAAQHASTMNHDAWTDRARTGVANNCACHESPTLLTYSPSSAAVRLSYLSLKMDACIRCHIASIWLIISHQRARCGKACTHTHTERGVSPKIERQWTEKSDVQCWAWASHFSERCAQTHQLYWHFVFSRELHDGRSARLHRHSFMDGVQGVAQNDIDLSTLQEACSVDSSGPALLSIDRAPWCDSCVKWNSIHFQHVADCSRHSLEPFAQNALYQMCGSGAAHRVRGYIALTSCARSAHSAQTACVFAYCGDH